MLVSFRSDPQTTESFPRAMQLHVTTVSGHRNSINPQQPLRCQISCQLYNTAGYLEFIYASRDLLDPSVPKAMLARRDWRPRPVHIRMHSGNDSAAHLVALKERGFIADGGPRTWDIVRMMQQKKMKNEPRRRQSTHSLTGATRDWLFGTSRGLGARDVPRHLYSLPESAGTRTGGVCGSVNMFPSEIPNMRQTSLLPVMH